MNTTIRHTPLGLTRTMSGVTLVELMIVVVIVSILGTIAVPSYLRYSMRSQRTEAKSALLQIATNQERFYLQNNTYSSDLTDLGFGAASNAPTEQARYTLDVNSANAIGYEVQAAAANQMTADDDCAVFFINAQGRRWATPDTRGDCW